MLDFYKFHEDKVLSNFKCGMAEGQDTNEWKEFYIMHILFVKFISIKTNIFYSRIKIYLQTDVSAFHRFRHFIDF